MPSLPTRPDCGQLTGALALLLLICQSGPLQAQSLPSQRAADLLRGLRAAAHRSHGAWARSDAAGAPAGAARQTTVDPAPVVATTAAPRPATHLRTVAIGDGQIVDRQRLFTIGNVALDIVAYLSSGLVVGGLLCYADDGQAHSTIIHLHGGLGGIFVNPDGGDIVGTCYSWATQGRTAFVPSFRGQDGSEGQPELCLGEADDVANAAVMLRTLDEVDPDRMALIGGSMGGCVALRAGTRIPNLRAVVAIAPPTDWKWMVDYHRHEFAPAVETRCDASAVNWNIGGTEFADTIDDIICGHPGCPDEAYIVRSPVPDALEQINPTLVVAAGGDNIVPPVQQLLWSMVRQQDGGTVAIHSLDRCTEPMQPSPVFDVILYVPGAFHLVENNVIYSALGYMLGLLDAPGPALSDAATAPFGRADNRLDGPT